MQDPSGCGKAAGRKEEEMASLLCRHVDGAFGQFRGDGQTVCRQGIGVDVQVGIADGLVGDILGAFAAQDARRDESRKAFLTLRGRPETITASRLYAHLFKGM